MEVCLSRRKGKPALRPLMARMCYEITGGTSWREQLPVLAAVELLNISTYQSNFCFDEKAGINSASGRNGQFICSMLTFSRSLAVLDSATELAARPKAEIASLLARSNDQVYQGQFYDLNLLTFDMIANFPTLDEFTALYLERCNLIAGSTFRACAAGAILNDPSPDILNALITYLGNLGSAAQVINDLGDYIPQVTKDYAQPYSDLNLGRLTLPAYLLHKAGLPMAQLRQTLRTEGSTSPIGMQITEAIRDLRLVPQVRTFVKEQLFPAIHSSIRMLEKHFGADRAAELRFAYPFIFESRLLRYFAQKRSCS